MLQKPGRLNGPIYGPCFDVHGTQGERINGISGQDFTQGPKKARLSLMIVHQQHGGAHYTLRMSEEEGYRYSLEARIYSGDQEEKSAAVESLGRRMETTSIMSVARNSLLGKAITQSNGFTAVVRVTTVSAYGQQVDTTLDIGKKIQTPLSLANDNLEALKSGEFADCTLKSEDGDEFLVHRQILAIRSPYFGAMLFGSMREAQTGIAQIKASSAAVTQLLQCVYTDEIDAKVAEPVSLELLELGKQYQLPRLVDLVTALMLSTLSVDNAAERFLLAVQISLADLEEACESIITGNLAAVMLTAGWAEIAKNPSAMSRLINGEKDGKKGRNRPTKLSNSPSRQDYRRRSRSQRRERSNSRGGHGRRPSGGFT